MTDPRQIGLWLLAAAVVLAIAGVGLIVAGRLPFLGNLPGDFTFRRGGVTIFAPLASSLLLSLILTLVLNLLLRR